MDLSQQGSMDPSNHLTKALKVLIVDDEVTNCFILERMISKDGYQVLMASDGIQAVELFQAEAPDLILMDVMMPVMDGYQAAAEIKRRCGERYVPIIFVTALADEVSLAKCLEIGGDDFLSKPYNRLILRAKMRACLRSAVLVQKIKEQKDEILFHRDRLIAEQEVAGEIFEKILCRASFDEKKFRFLFSPSSVLNGDILLITDTPNQHSFVLFGDFTGHGLPAAIGSIPVADIFYSMAGKGHGAIKLLEEINAKLRLVLPVNVFLAAAMLDIDHIKQSLAVWNGGLPSIRVYNAKAASERAKFESSHLALGILDTMDGQMDHIQMIEGDKVYLYSDGLTDAVNSLGDRYGEARLQSLFSQQKNAQNMFAALVNDVRVFCGDALPNDDLSLVEYTFVPQEIRVVQQNSIQSEQKFRENWKLDFHFDIQTLRHLDPLPLVLHNIMEVQKLEGQQQKLYMILAELYVNSLDHGLLELDSSLKQSVQGFTEYYELKQRRLHEYQAGHIDILIEYFSTDFGGRLSIQVEDSGPGFDFFKIMRNLDNNIEFSGRGIALVRSLCESVAYFDRGNKVCSVFSWP